ncbi:MAG: FAD-binding oxidoreductase [Methylobacterium sp.]|nr:FAD-binding oxidoreductase [Methylobacterium sp.]MCA3655822.1 FAD-binding oxidoreductase [Methylobacterium sp.]MCA3659596.1 FAD-binding oxidoreductase [Methylobacterium sp.]MCA3663817.1 FAD-binding oxidoreductase [Methylobacterium sp.]MCA3671879.1 FAD-binding oxidoreductase [Methylobacterium sp.]
MAENHDVVIAGGAVTGSSTAWHLAAHPGFSGRILVVEPDMTYQRSASALSAGSIRQQFSQPVNIAISLHGIGFLRAIGEILAVESDRPNVGLHEGGYLYLGEEAHREGFTANNAIQRAMGADIALLDAAELKRTFPWLETSDLAIGSYGVSGEGWFDGYGLMQAFRAKARSLGVEYRKGRVTGVEIASGRVTGVTLEDGSRIGCATLVNAAGASGARALSAEMGFPVPIYAKKRSVFSFSCKEALPRHPLIIDKSGVWWRPEGEGYITGYSPDDLDETDHSTDFEVDWALFEEVIWPALAMRIPAFEAIRPGRAWAGHYDMNLLDHNALVGWVPGLANGFIACGFSGHGLQQSPALGRGLAELITEGRYTSLDLADLSPERVLTSTPLLERNVI